MPRATQAYYVRGLPAFLERRGPVLGEEARRHLTWLVQHGDPLLRRLAGPPTSLLHGDYRLDNLFHDRVRGEIIVGDWQTMNHGLPAQDVAYFLSGSLRPEVSNAEEEALLDGYHRALEERGVSGYTRADLARDYQLCLLLMLQRMVLTDSDLIEIGGVRGEALVDGWLDRILRRLEGVDPDALLARVPSCR